MSEDNGQNVPNETVLSKQCDFCGWQGGDVDEVQYEKGSVLVCQTCSIAGNIEEEKLGEVHPQEMIPLIRSCVAQVVGAIMGEFLDHMVRVMSACASEGMSIAEKSAVIQAAADSLKRENN